MTPLNLQGLISIIFSVFLLTQLFSTIDQQIIPRLVINRDLFEAREQQSKSYSWIIFVTANVIVELVWQTFTAVLVFVAWYYPLGLWKNGDPSMLTAERCGLAFAVIWMFFLFISTLSQAVGIAIQHPETAVQIATLFFYLSLIFCGYVFYSYLRCNHTDSFTSVIVKPDDLPRFWLFMYRASPLTYFISGVVTAGLAHTQITCSSIEMLRIALPAGRTCGEYIKSFIQVAGGFVEDANAVDRCGYCPVGDADAFMQTMGIDVDYKWRNVWFLFCYVVFNVIATFFLYWVARAPKRGKS
jgi:ATP-binding cassette subfamily G (WHITE) protein 2 (PDR)